MRAHIERTASQTQLRSVMQTILTNAQPEGFLRPRCEKRPRREKRPTLPPVCIWGGRLKTVRPVAVLGQRQRLASVKAPLHSLYILKTVGDILI